MRSTFNVVIQILAIVVTVVIRSLTPSTTGTTLATVSAFVLLPQVVFAVLLLRQYRIDDHTAAVFVWLALVTVGLAFVFPDLGPDGLDRAPLLRLFVAHPSATAHVSLASGIGFGMVLLVAAWCVLWCYALGRVVVVHNRTRPVRPTHHRRA